MTTLTTQSAAAESTKTTKDTGLYAASQKVSFDADGNINEDALIEAVLADARSQVAALTETRNQVFDLLESNPNTKLNFDTVKSQVCAAALESQNAAGEAAHLESGSDEPYKRKVCLGVEEVKAVNDRVALVVAIAKESGQIVSGRGRGQGMQTAANTVRIAAEKAAGKLANGEG